MNFAIIDGFDLETEKEIESLVKNIQCSGGEYKIVILLDSPEREKRLEWLEADKMIYKPCKFDTVKSYINEATVIKGSEEKEEVEDIVCFLDGDDPDYDELIKGLKNEFKNVRIVVSTNSEERRKELEELGASKFYNKRVSAQNISQLTRWIRNW